MQVAGIRSRYATVFTKSNLRLAKPYRAMSSSSSPSSSSYRDSESQTFTLPDGRTLGYAEYGPSNGYPLFYFHGFPSSRIEAFPLDKVAHHRRIRVIALDRPGFGLSTFQPHRQFLDWPKDVAAFAQAKGVEKFSVLGASGGGPYAIACAKALPRHMMTSVGVFAGGPPWVAGRQHMPWFSRFSERLVNFSPTIFAGLARVIVSVFDWFVNLGPIKRRLDRVLENLRQKEQEKEKDKPEGEKLGMVGNEEYTAEQRRDRLLRLLYREPFVQGVAGFVHETKLLSDKSWGFEFEEVRYGPIRIWHGAKDYNAPIQMIRYMVDKLPNAVLTEFDGSHFTIANHIPGALLELIPEEEIKRHEEEMAEKSRNG
ncbi:hypothetical protein TWF694_011403 [Orbilia ellipsospora]|uniref:AB hydrolase-1 domain-containing protein n=1 Tax=Orbilia ellipsospora TaxID=2528407 RepID=A0AAV9X6D3_9PEZI